MSKLNPLSPTKVEAMTDTSGSAQRPTMLRNKFTPVEVGSFDYQLKQSSSKYIKGVNGQKIHVGSPSGKREKSRNRDLNVLIKSVAFRMGSPSS